MDVEGQPPFRPSLPLGGREDRLKPVHQRAMADDWAVGVPPSVSAVVPASGRCGTKAEGGLRPSSQLLMAFYHRETRTEKLLILNPETLNPGFSDQSRRWREAAG